MKIILIALLVAVAVWILTRLIRMASRADTHWPLDFSSSDGGGDSADCGD